MKIQHPQSLQDALSEKRLMPFIGVYDVFSASIAARHFDGLFLSGFSFAASFYGLPDIGLISWSDMAAFVKRVRTILPCHQILVDIDDGYGGPDMAAHVVSVLEISGANGIVIEDQKRTKKCGHLDGKLLLDQDDFIDKLSKVLKTRRKMFVVARTDAVVEEEILTRVKRFEEAGADAVFVDAIRDKALIKKLKELTNLPIMVNKIAGGKSPDWSFQELKNSGVSMVNFSTPCLFAAQEAVEHAMHSLKESDGTLNVAKDDDLDFSKCTSILNENLKRRDVL